MKNNVKDTSDIINNKKISSLVNLLKKLIGKK